MAQTLKFYGNPNQIYKTRGQTYTADSTGVVSVSTSNSQFFDITDLLMAGCVPLGQTQSVSNVKATTDPGIGNDNTQNYGAGSMWLNTSTGTEWRAVSVATGAAVWVPMLGGSGVLLGRLTGANMNVTTDQAFTMTQWSALNPFRVTKITAKNASISLTTAAGGIYPAITKGGTALVASGQAYSALTATTLAVDLTIATTPGLTVQAKTTSYWLSLTTAQGSAATADLYMWGDIYY